MEIYYRIEFTGDAYNDRRYLEEGIISAENEEKAKQKIEEYATGRFWMSYPLDELEFTIEPVEKRLEILRNKGRQNILNG